MNTIDYALCVRLQLENCIELRREVKRRIATYVDLNPRPTTLSVTIVIGHKDDVRGLIKALAIARALRTVKVEEMIGINKEGEDECCSICLVKFAKENEGIRTVTCMPCKHVFHYNCIFKWLFKNPICPLCRFKLDV
ncbi:hypothetical protein vseg_017129 [Gypsophila vaccaria]